MATPEEKENPTRTTPSQAEGDREAVEHVEGAQVNPEANEAAGEGETEPGRKTPSQAEG
jgi:hypothetical protein